MRNEKKIILFTCSAHFLFHFCEIAFPALAIPLTLSLGMDLKEVLKLGFPMYLLFGLCALPWGVFADHFGNRLALIICFFGSGVGALLTAFSSSPTAIMASLALIGAFVCICHPAGMGFISRGVRNRGTALGINAVAGSIGLVVSPFVVALLNWLAGWRLAYIVIAILSLLGGVAMVLVKIDETPLVRPETGRNAARGGGIHWVRVLVFFGIVTLGGLAYRINIISLPAYLEFNAPFLARFLQSLRLPDIPAMTTLAAALLTSVIYILGIAGQLAGGRLADRHDLRRLYLLFNGMTLPFVLLMGLLTEQPLFLAAAAYVFFALGIQPIENSLIALFTPPKWQSTGFGLAAILIFGVGSGAVYVIGWVRQLWFFGAVYLLAGGIILCILLGILLLMRLTKGMTYRNG